jgi:hypothetical protein
MVGRETFVTLIQGLPATSAFVFFVTLSGLDTGSALGIFAFQIGIWFCPEHGCDPCAIADVVTRSKANDETMEVLIFMELFPFLSRIAGTTTPTIRAIFMTRLALSTLGALRRIGGAWVACTQKGDT